MCPKLLNLSFWNSIKLTETKEDEANYSRELPNEPINVESNIRTKDDEIAVAHLLQSEEHSKQNFKKNIQENKVVSKTYKTFHQENLKNNSLSVSDLIEDDKQSSNGISKTDKIDDLSFLTELQDKTSNQKCAQDKVEIAQKDLLYAKITDVDTMGFKNFACKSAHTNPDIRKTVTVSSAYSLLHQNPATVSDLKTKPELSSDPQKAVVIPMQGGEPHPSVVGDEKTITEPKSVQKESKQQLISETISVQTESPVITNNEQKINIKCTNVSKQSTSNLVSKSQPQTPLESIVHERTYQSTFSGYPPSLFYGGYPFSAPLISSNVYSATTYAQAHQNQFGKSMIKSSQPPDSNFSKHTPSRQVDDKSKTTRESIVKEMECKQTQNTDKLEQPSVCRSRSRSVNFDQAKQKDASSYFSVKPKLKQSLMSQNQFKKSTDDQKVKQLKSLICSKSSAVNKQVS